METPLFQDIVVILGLSVVVLLIFQKLKLPTILGFLITGMIAGPYGLSLIEAIEEVDKMAELGVILLLFIIGLEFSLKSLSAIKRSVFIGGSLQVGITIFVTALILYLLDYSVSEAVFTGFLFSLSSTAIVLKLLQEKGEINSPHGRFSLAVLIFQDIIVVPMMLVAPMLGGQSQNIYTEILWLLVKGGFIIGFVIVAARYIVPTLLYQVARTKSKELFVLTIVVICFAVAWLTSEMGLSLALGAFMAGLIISESEYSHQATSNILPLREVFTSFFFVSIGMLLDLNFFIHHAGFILLLTVITVIGKGIVVWISALILKYPVRTTILVSLSLFQVGEFSFILSKTGMEYNLLSGNLYQYFLSVAILSMGITPFVINAHDVICNFLIKTPIPRAVKDRLMQSANQSIQQLDEGAPYEDHLIIVGYGINGKNVARAAKMANIPYLILELNAQTVKQEKAKGEPIMYGDAIDDMILKHVYIHKARVVVVAISDPTATKKIISGIRAISNKVYIIIRTRFLKDIDENLNLGANEVIPEEFETSIEIFTRVLNKYLVPLNEIDNFIRQIRADNYEMLRPANKLHPEKRSPQIEVPGIEIATLTAQKEGNGIIGRKISESQVRETYGVTILAIKRDKTFIQEVTPDLEIRQDDVLYVFGKPEAIAEFDKKIKI